MERMEKRNEMRADNQTAMQWFEFELKDKLGKIVINQDWQLLETIIQQAKEMERGQLIEFYEDGLYSAYYPFGLTGEAYYEQEYGNK